MTGQIGHYSSAVEMVANARNRQFVAILQFLRAGVDQVKV